MFWIIAVVIVVIVALTLLVFRMEDLSHFDQEEYSVREASPSAENQNVLELLKEMRRAGKGLRGKARLLAMRKHMDSLSDGLDLQSEFRQCSTPKGEWVIAPGADTRRRILYIHGGAWAVGSPRSHRSITDRLSHIANAAVFSLDYRLMPEHRFMDGVRHPPHEELAVDRIGGEERQILEPYVRDKIVARRLEPMRRLIDVRPVEA